MRNLRLISSLFFWSVIVIASISSVKVFAVANLENQDSKEIIIDGALPMANTMMNLYTSVYGQIGVRGNDNIEDLMFIITEKTSRPLVIKLRNVDLLKQKLGLQGDRLLKGIKRIHSENSNDITLTGWNEN